MTKQLPKKLPRGLQFPVDDEDKYFYTYDIGCCSALICSGFKLVAMNKANPNKVLFILNREIGIEKIVDDYWADRLEVKARAFFDNIKMLKNRIYSE